jgi:hypothetical protein
VGVGFLLFVPWVPTFLYQAKHTGTPWAAPPNFSAVINAVTGFTDNQGSTLSTGTNQGRLLAIIYFAMLALALFGLAKNDRIIELDLHTRPRARGTTFVVVGTLFAAIAGGILTSSAFSVRYAAVVFLPLILLVALGTTTLLSPRVRVVVVAIAAAAGLVSCAQNVTTQRTQANSVAAVINAQARPGDVIGFCPDQLGPSVYRQVDNPSQYHMITFPRETSPAIVDWVVWMSQYQTYGIKCETIATDLLNASTRAGGGGRNLVIASMKKYYEPMNLTEFTPGGP